MKILEGVSNYEVTEANVEALRLALNYMGEDYAAAYFHGIAGTAFRIGGICPCAPTCAYAMRPQELIRLLGYECAEYPYDDGNKGAALERMLAAVRGSIDIGVPALVWHAFTACEWDIVTGYDENEKVFYGRGSYAGNIGEYAKNPWDNTLSTFASNGIMAMTVKRGSGVYDKKRAEIAALNEAVRHANDAENTDKQNGEWVFLQGKAAYNRWADDFSKHDYARSNGDAYCIGIYASCHAQAGPFLRGIAPGYPGASGALLQQAAALFDKEAGCLERLAPLLGWASPETDARRNEKAAELLREAAGHYGAAMDLLADF